MESHKPTNKFTRWALLFKEYNFEVVHTERTFNLYANGLPCNQLSSLKDLTRARWHRDRDR